MRVLAFLSFILMSSFSFSQVGINTIEPDPSAMLDIVSTNKGVLFPRMDLGDLSVASPVSNPQEGLMAWNTDASNAGANKGFYFWEGVWKPFCITNNSTAPTGVFGELTLNNNFVLNANQNDFSYINSPSSGTSSGVTLNSSQFSITPQISGSYRVKFTVTYNKANTNGANNLTFSIDRNNSRLTTFPTVQGPLGTTQTKLEYSEIIDLDANQTYSIRISSTSNPNVQINVYRDLAQFSIERL